MRFILWDIWTDASFTRFKSLRICQALSYIPEHCHFTPSVLQDGLMTNKVTAVHVIINGSIILFARYLCIKILCNINCSYSEGRNNLMA